MDLTLAQKLHRRAAKRPSRFKGSREKRRLRRAWASNEASRERKCEASVRACIKAAKKAASERKNEAYVYVSPVRLVTETGRELRGYIKIKPTNVTRVLDKLRSEGFKVTETKINETWQTERGRLLTEVKVGPFRDWLRVPVNKSALSIWEISF